MALTSSLAERGKPCGAVSRAQRTGGAAGDHRGTHLQALVESAKLQQNGGSYVRDRSLANAG